MITSTALAKSSSSSASSPFTTTKQVFGQLVIGPPGSGKTTYCRKMTEFLKDLDRRVEVVNLDPANEQMEYECEIDIMRLITAEDAMDHFKLGPNGALMYCLEYLEKNLDWMERQLQTSVTEKGTTYFIFDCPGQVELYTHHDSMSKIFQRFAQLGYHNCVVHLIDSHFCSAPHKYISGILLSLSTMLQMALPQVNVLSKADQMKQFSDKLDFNMDFYTEVLNLDYLLDRLDTTEGLRKYKKLNASIVSLIEDFGLVSFLPLDVNNQRSLLALKNQIDKANGYIYGAGEEKSINSLLACAVGAQPDTKRYENMWDEAPQGQ